MRTRSPIPVLLICAGGLLCPSQSTGQVVGPPAEEPEPVGAVEHDRVVSINPILLVFTGSVSAAYEQRVATATTLGASVAKFSLSDATYRSLDVRGRYYVGGRALDGLSVGAVLGYTWMEADDETGDGSSAMLIGFNAEHQWLMGVDERLALTAGLGASRLFGGEDRDPFRTVLPLIRLSLGWAF